MYLKSKWQISASIPDFFLILQTSNRKELSQPDKDKEWTINTGNNVDQSQNNYSAWKKLDQKIHIM